jgi:hypothetical protein
MGRAKKHLRVLFVWPINIVMIARINFGLGMPTQRPQAPIGNPIGHAVAQTLPRPAVHNLIVRTPYAV